MNLRLLTLACCFALSPAFAETAPPAAGATVPWTTYKAEQAHATTGEKLTSRKFGDIANEALNHTCVKLAATNQHLTWKVRNPANTLVVRACVPDSPQGGGVSHTLTVAVNGVARQKITLSSHHSWLYGKDPNGNDNMPGTGTPHAFFDETREFLTGAPLKTGDTITLYKQAADTAPWYVIDLVDLEWAPPPAPMPPEALSVIDFGAIPDDDKSDSTAFAACVEKARAEGKTVWVPAGVFHQTEQLELDRIKVRGAGPWHTRLVGLGELKPNFFAGNVGFKLTGTDVEVSGFTIDGSITTRSTDEIQHGVTGGADRFLVEDLWVRHTNTGMWIGSCQNGIVRRCRFRDTYADGINVNNHSESVVVEQCHSRGNGDDGFAVFAGTEKGGVAGTCRNIAIKHNTAEAQRWGNGVGVYGGDGIQVNSNLIISANRCSGITASTGFDSWPMNGTAITGNVLTDCGGTAFNQRFSALHVYLPGKDILGLTVRDNTIRSASFAGLDITGTANGGQIDAVVSDNIIESPGDSAIQISDTVRGRLTLKSNKISGLREKSKLANSSKPDQLSLTSDLRAQ